MKIIENKIIQGDALKILKTFPAESVQCFVTSPPYWGLRDYGVEGQLGLEDTPEKYVLKIVEIFREGKRVLMKNGTLWLNMGDSYCHDRFTSKMDGTFKGTDGLYSRKFHYMDGCSSNGPKRSGGVFKTKDLMGIPWMVAFALRADGWYLRSDIIWSKPNPMPESVTDRPTKAHEYIFLLSKSQKYYYDAEAILEPIAASTKNDTRYREDNFTTNRPERGYPEKNQQQGSGMLRPKGNAKTFRGGRYTQDKPDTDRDSHGNEPNTTGKRNKRTVWEVATQPYNEAHFATFPENLIKPCILAGCPEKGIVLDPFMGAGTTALVAKNLNRRYAGIELNPEYIKISDSRLSQTRLNV